MTVVAAAGASLWEPPALVFAWLGVNLGLIGLGQWLYRWLSRRSSPPAAAVWIIAGYTFVATAIYALLPMALIARGEPTAVIAGMAMAAAISLSSTSEFVTSAWVGSAAFAALGVTVAAGVLIADGGRRPLNLVAALVAIACLALYIVRHAQHRRRVEAGLVEARRLAEARGAEAEAANAAKSTFLATMSHEIRTPMNGVLGMAQMMAAGDLAAVQRERLAVLQESGEALMGLLNDVLDFAKIEAGKLECEQIPFDLVAALTGVVALFQAQAVRKAIILQMEFDEAAQGVFLGDPLRVRQILNNLISNALKFTDSGRIDVKLARDGEMLRLSVADSGAGMPSDRLHHLFDKFQQLDASTTRRHGGTGLGLAICRELCGLMGGSISAESILGRGSTFTVRLNLPRIGEPSLRAARARGAWRPLIAANDLHLRVQR